MPLDNDQSYAADCLVLNRPAWFKREDFCAWRRGNGQARPATWDDLSQPPHEFADTFSTFDAGNGNDWEKWEGGDADTLPQDIYAEIGREIHERQLTHGVLWIKNVG